MSPGRIRPARRKSIFGIFFLLLYARIAQGGGGEDASQAYQLARDLHLRGAAGNTDAAMEALEMLEDLARESPEDPLILAYLGSAKLLEAKRAWLPWRKQALGEKGLELLDRAVDSAPDNLEIRFLRGMSSYPLPSLFDREKQAAEDFAFVAARAGQPGEEIESRIAAGACYYHGLCLAASGRAEAARGYWKQAIELDPGSTFARNAAEKIRGEN